jgi:hypothetical protein
MRTRDAFTLVKDALCMIVALGGAAYEAARDHPPRWELLAFYALILGFGTAVPAAQSLFSTTNQEYASPESPRTGSAPVNLRHPRRSPRGGGDTGTTSPRSQSRRS